MLNIYLIILSLKMNTNEYHVDELRYTVDVLINLLSGLNFSRKNVNKHLKEKGICDYCFYGFDECECIRCLICDKVEDICKCKTCDLCGEYKCDCKPK
jgi:hypothetical protein